MTAVACVRVVVDRGRTDLPQARLDSLVAKFSLAFLEVRWAWPRQATPLSAYSYLLSDPRATDLDTAELAQLSRQLQERLFGAEAHDAVRLLLFEGSQAEVAAFAAASGPDIDAILAGALPYPGGGRLQRIGPDGALHGVPAEDPSGPQARIDLVCRDGVQGIYFPNRELFIGDVVTCTPELAADYYSLVDGEEHLPQDAEAYSAACLQAAARLLKDGRVTASLFLPVSFSCLVRASSRASFETQLKALPDGCRRQVSAAVYNVPRAPSWQALQWVRGAVSGHFSGIDLRTTDPMFEIEQLAEDAATSVTLVLPSGEQELRLSAIRRFADGARAYKKRRIWPGVANIRSAAERDLAVDLGVPFLTGPGICRIQEAPIGGRLWPLRSLPVLSGAVH